MSKIEVVEVGPRDGFQSVRCAAPIASELKLEVIDKLIAAGVKHMEYTSFVSPKAIPQLADAQTCSPECPICGVRRTPTNWDSVRCATWSR